jgi:hypothetical protein
MLTPLGPHDPCACLSGIAVRDCCPYLVPPPFIAAAKMSLRQYAHPKCYARALGNCSTDLSDEHFLSESVLAVVHPTKVTVAGFAWLGDNTRRIPNKRLAARILCKAHNEALSGLDESGRRFFQWMQDAIIEFAQDHPKAQEDWIRAVNGHDLERWMMKALFGLIASGVAENKSPDLSKLPPPIEALRILFGYDPIPQGWGMYWRTQFGVEENNSFALEVATITRDAAVGGLFLRFNGHEIWFLMQKGALAPEIRPPEFSYRPMDLDFRYRSTQKVIHLGWSDDLLLSEEVAPVHGHLTFELPRPPIPPIPDPD